METVALFNRRTVIFCCFLIILSLGTAYAQRSAEGNGTAIREKIQAVLDKTETLGVRLGALCNDVECQTSPAGQKFNQKLERLRQSQTRAKNAHGRSQDADYQELVRRRPKHKSEGCNPEVQVCDQTVVAGVAAANEPEFDEERGKDMVEDLDEVGADLDELNAILEGYVPPPSPTPDVELENAAYFFSASLRPSTGLAYGAFIASQVAQKVSAIADHGCDQTAVALGFGGNAAAACIAAETVFQLVDYVYQIMAFIRDETTANEVTGTYKRTKNIFDQLAISDGNVDAIKAVVEAMGKKLLMLEENQKLIIQLLRTPEGQRLAVPPK